MYFCTRKQSKTDYLKETISITTNDSKGRPTVTIWDRCGLPQNMQEVFGTDVPQMTKDISRFMADGFVNTYGNQPDMPLNL